MRDHSTPGVILRLATAADADRLLILAQLDSSRVPAGEVLIAEVDGRLQAALPLDGGEPIADPFRRTAGLVALLRVHATQLLGRNAAAVTSLSALERRTADLRPPKPLAPL
jgi:hypothetical protein